MQFIAPILALIFGLLFIALSRLLPGQRHLPFFGGGFILCAGAAALVQSQEWWTFGSEALLAAGLYIGGGLLLSGGIVARAGASPPHLANVVICVGSVGTLFYLRYADLDIAVKLNLINLAFSLLLLAAVWRARPLRHGQLGDRLLFWVALIFALHLIPRMLIAGSLGSHADMAAFLISPYWMWIQASMAILATVFGVVVLGAAASDVIEGLRRERDTDPLTGLLNRRGLEGRMAELASRGPEPRYSVIMCDLDHFKRVNDTYGHAAGDTVLAELALEIRSVLRGGDVAARIGGEEFVIVVRDASAADAYAICERLRGAIEARHFSGMAMPKQITASAGVAEKRPGETLRTTIERADAILYKAKNAGRNRTYAESVQFPTAA